MDNNKQVKKDVKKDEIDILLEQAEKIFGDPNEKPKGKKGEINQTEITSLVSDEEIKRRRKEGLPHGYVCDKCHSTEFELIEENYRKYNDISDIYKCKNCGQIVLLNLNPEDSLD